MHGPLERHGVGHIDTDLPYQSLGVRHAAPVRADAVVLAKLDRLVPLAPLHQPRNLAPVRALLARIRGEGAMPAVQISVRAESERRPSGCGRGQG